MVAKPSDPLIIGPMGRYQINFLEEYTDEASLADLRRGSLFDAGYAILV
jgi:hypothetical protein